MKKWKLYSIFLIAAVVCAGIYFSYVAWAFPTTKCEAAKHLSSPQMEGDCYACHAKATAKVAQEWYESKHGVILVRCQTCHGMPDGKGSLPFTRNPGKDVCNRCHSLAVDRMEAKFGRVDECSSCHPHHQSPMHGNVYEFRQGTDKTTL